MAFPKKSDESLGGTIGGTMGGTIGGTMGGPMDDLTDRQKEVLSLIEKDTKLTIRQLAELLNINVSAAQAHIAILEGKKNNYKNRRHPWLLENSNGKKQFSKEKIVSVPGKFYCVKCNLS